MLAVPRPGFQTAHMSTTAFHPYQELRPALGRQPALPVARAINAVRGQIVDAHRAVLASKGDLAGLQLSIHDELASLRLALEGLRQTFRTELNERSQGVQKQLEDLRLSLRAKWCELKSSIVVAFHAFLQRQSWFNASVVLAIPLVKRDALADLARLVHLAR